MFDPQKKLKKTRKMFDPKKRKDYSVKRKYK